MKLATLVFTFALAPAAALACPNLAGTWSCSDAGQPSQEMTVSQQASPGGATYSLTSADGTVQRLQADDVAHVSADSDGNTVTTTVTCQGDTGLRGVETLTNVDHSYSADGTFAFVLPDASTLNGSSTSVFHQPGKPDQSESTTAACKRK